MINEQQSWNLETTSTLLFNRCLFLNNICSIVIFVGFPVRTKDVFRENFDTVLRDMRNCFGIT